MSKLNQPILVFSLFFSLLLVISTAFADGQDSATVISAPVETKEEILAKEALRVAEQKKQQSALESLVNTEQAL